MRFGDLGPLRIGYLLVLLVVPVIWIELERSGEINCTVGQVCYQVCKLPDLVPIVISMRIISRTPDSALLMYQADFHIVET